MPDKIAELAEVLRRCARTDWWVEEPKPAYVSLDRVRHTPGSRLLGFTIRPAVRNSVSLTNDLNAQLANFPDELSQLEYLVLSGADLTGPATRWLSYLREVRYIEFNNCSVDANTFGSLQLADEIRVLTIRNSLVTQVEALAGLANTRVIQLVDTQVSARDLLEVRGHLPSCMLQSFRTQGHSTVPLLPPAEPLYRPDLATLKRIRTSMRKMSKRLSGLGFETNSDRAWTTKDGLQAEKALGYRIPSDLRFALRMHDGQFNDALWFTPFQAMTQVVDETIEQQTTHWDEPEFFSLRDANGQWHYPLLSFMGQGATSISIDLVTGEIVWRDAADGEVLAPSLVVFLERLEAEMQKSKIDQTTSGKHLNIYPHSTKRKDAVPFGEFRRRTNR